MAPKTECVHLQSPPQTSCSPLTPTPSFPPVRACLFDMDGLILNTEDLYTQCINFVLAKYNKPPLPWSIKAQLQGRPAAAAAEVFQAWANLPVDYSTYMAEVFAHQQREFPSAEPLPGVATLLRDLARAPGVHIALATSSQEATFNLKVTNHQELFSVFDPHRRVLGDDKRLAPGRGKPLPDIYHLALKTINDSLPEGEPPITLEECLVFEDSVPGVESGRRAGMRVIWCPHEGLVKEYAGREEEVLAGRTGAAGDVDMHQVGEIGDGWAQHLPSLVDFPYKKYGIVIPAEEQTNGTHGA